MPPIANHGRLVPSEATCEISGSPVPGRPGFVGVAFRIGGLVEKASVHHGAGADVRFVVTDGARAVPIDFNGVLPALFREGQGVVATGALNPGGTFDATEILAKHDEKYMPPEVARSLQRNAAAGTAAGTPAQPGKTAAVSASGEAR